ncbi:MAG: hypothetical protein J3K34DRAFT_448245 [Monoraphidium minutum]|nr:MAG: hypothetical protein J3K34DRAFT_448245 [Monoraphidium minutum]
MPPLAATPAPFWREASPQASPRGPGPARPPTHHRPRAAPADVHYRSSRNPTHCSVARSHAAGRGPFEARRAVLRGRRLPLAVRDVPPSTTLLYRPAPRTLLYRTPRHTVVPPRSRGPGPAICTIIPPLPPGISAPLAPPPPSKGRVRQSPSLRAPPQATQHTS